MTGTGARWPCSCGAPVPIENDTCPECGTDFLNDLKEDAPGRHREGARGLLLGKSRAARMTIALVLGLIVAIAVPALLAFFG